MNLTEQRYYIIINKYWIFSQNHQNVILWDCFWGNFSYVRRAQRAFNKDYFSKGKVGFQNHLSNNFYVFLEFVHKHFQLNKLSVSISIQLFKKLD